MSSKRFAVCIALGLAVQLGAAPRYRITTRLPDGVESAVFNNKDQIAAAIFNLRFIKDYKSMIVENGSIQPMEDPPEGKFINIAGINEEGIVLLRITGDEPNTQASAYLWKAGRYSPAPGIPRVSAQALALGGLNESGDLVGTLSFRAFSVVDGTFNYIPLPEGYVSAAVGINESGAVAVDISDEAMKPRHAAIWKGGKVIELGTLSDKPRSGSYALAINDAGTVAGWGTDGLGGGLGFTASAGKILAAPRVFPEALGVLEHLYSINNFHIAGSEKSILVGGKHYLLDEITPRDTAVYESLTHVMAINDRGQILANASTPTGIVTVLLDPIPSSNPGRLVNLSVRSRTGTGEETSIVGFAVFKPGQFLIRAGGPALDAFDVKGAARDPNMTLFASDKNVIDQNDNWAAGGSVSDHLETMDRVGAFRFARPSLDASLVKALGSGSYTIHTNAESAQGIALTEIYDATEGTSTEPRLTNLSTRVYVGDGDGLGIVGFVIGGEGRCRLLIRAVGPGLAQFGIQRALTDPLLWIYNDEGRPVLGNDSWGAKGDFPLLDKYTTQLKLFPLEDGSTDCVALIELEPGQYTAQVTGVNGAKGVALLELFALPEDE